ncbi:hypothetical protein ACE1BV_03450 [Aeromonas hydrophila]|uniref:hypothetical protein n=1 Tax=Aeromonas hydrophila TaxID=644 RepID=UPI0035B76F8C
MLIEINKKLVRNVFLNTELLLNEGEKEIFEYDIQAFMFLFLKRHLKGTSYTAGREKVSKVDCVIFYNKGKNSIPACFYEIKTYFKSREKIQESDFDNDLDKLANLIATHSDTKGIFITAGLTAKYNNTAASRLPFIEAHLKNDRTWQSRKLPSGITVKLRPSTKEVHGLCNVMTWEVII